MDKFQFVEYMRDKGFACEMFNGVPTIFEADKTTIHKVRAEIQNCGYRYSFAVKMAGKIAG